MVRVCQGNVDIPVFDAESPFCAIPVKLAGLEALRRIQAKLVLKRGARSECHGDFKILN